MCFISSIYDSHTIIYYGSHRHLSRYASSPITHRSVITELCVLGFSLPCLDTALSPHCFSVKTQKTPSVTAITTALALRGMSAVVKTKNKRIALAKPHRDELFVQLLPTAEDVREGEPQQRYGGENVEENELSAAKALIQSMKVDFDVDALHHPQVSRYRAVVNAMLHRETVSMETILTNTASLDVKAPAISEVVRDANEIDFHTLSQFPAAQKENVCENISMYNE